MMSSINNYYNIAKEQYEKMGIDTDKVLDELKTISLSLNCCDEVEISSKKDVVSSVRKKANSPMLRKNLEAALKLIPGNHRLNLSVEYMDTNENVSFDEIEPRYYDEWLNWAKTNTKGVDLYTTMVKHEMADTGYTLSSTDKGIRYYWVEHCQRCRTLGDYFGKEMGTPCVTNININDIYEDIPIDSITSLNLLTESLDKIYAESPNKSYVSDSIFTNLPSHISNLYGVAGEDFFLSYSINQKLIINLNSLMLDTTSKIFQSINNALSFSERIIIHIRPEPNSNNTIVLNDKIINIAQHILRNKLLNRVSIQLDFYTQATDSARVKKWVMGAHAVQKAFLMALLEPSQLLQTCDDAKDFNSKTALLEGLKSYPVGAVWDFFCHTMNIPIGLEWMDAGKSH